MKKNIKYSLLAIALTGVIVLVASLLQAPLINSQTGEIIGITFFILILYIIFFFSEQK